MARASPVGCGIWRIRRIRFTVMTDAENHPKQTYCTRLEPELVSRLPGRGDAGDGNTSAALRQVVREWVATERFSGLEFRSSPLGRVAAVRGGPTIDVVRAVYRARGEKVRRLAPHFGEALPRATWTEAVGYLSELAVDAMLDEREGARRGKLSTLKSIVGWAVIPTHLLLDWRVPARVAELLRPDIDAVHIGESDESVGEFEEMLERARGEQRVLVTTRYYEVFAHRGSVPGDVALLRPVHDLARYEAIADSIQAWAGAPESEDMVGPWIPPLED